MSAEKVGDFVYVIRYDEGLHKIGRSSNPHRRVVDLQVGERRRLALVRTWWRPNGDAGRIEWQAHRLLSDWRESGERFEVGPTTACNAVDLAIALIDEAEEMMRWQCLRRRRGESVVCLSESEAASVDASPVASRSRVKPAIPLTDHERDKADEEAVEWAKRNPGILAREILKWSGK